MTGWAIIALGVAAAEWRSRVFGCPTPSAAALPHPLVVTATALYLWGHLTGRLPSRYDVLRGLR